MVATNVPTTLFPAVAALSLPGPPNQILLIIGGLLLGLFVVGQFISSRPPVKAKLAAGQDRAFGWIEASISAWEVDGRLSAVEADRLRGELREPEFAAVLPHLGVHLTIGVFLRFPIGSMTRASYTLSNMLLTHGRFVAHRIDHRSLRRTMGIHSPIVLLITCFPGTGTFAYLASKPFRAHHLLARVALDAVLLKLPRDVYTRSGVRLVIARAVGGTGTDAADDQGNRLGIRVLPARITAFLAVVAIGLFAADLVMQTANDIFAPSFIGWAQAQRILDLGSEASLGTWFAVVMLFLSATLLAVIACARQRAGDRFTRHWWFLALLVFGFSLDEQAKFHDAGGNLGGRAREILGLSGFLYYGWVLIALASVVLVGLLYRRFLIALPSVTRTAFLVAGAFYVGGEVLVEMVNGFLVDSQGETLLYQTMTSVEEFFGLIGLIIAMAALLGYVRDNVGELSVHLTGGAAIAATNDPLPTLHRQAVPSYGHTSLPVPSGGE